MTEPGNHVGDRIDITDVGVAIQTFGAMLRRSGTSNSVSTTNRSTYHPEAHQLLTVTGASLSPVPAWAFLADRSG